MKFRNSFLLLFLLATANTAFPQGYNFKNFNTEAGLAQPYIYSILQDAQGYLWVGTGNGLSRYNGFIFENYTTSDSLGDDFITCGIRDGESLWFGHMNGRLSFFNGKYFQVVNLPQTITSPITHFAKDSESRIWVSTYADGLLKLGMGSEGDINYKFKDDVEIISFDFLSTSELLIGTNAGLLHCRLTKSGEIEIVSAVAEIPDSKITNLQRMRNKSGFYVATENDGIFKIINKKNRFEVTKILPEPDFDYTGIQVIYEDSESNLWLGTFGKGLIKLIISSSGEHTGIQYFNTVNGFSTNNVKTVYEDREGNIWSGNYGDGLTQISPKTFTIYAFDKTLYGNDVFSVYFSQQYRWIGTEKGLVKMDPLTGKIIKFYDKASGLPRDSITAIYSGDGNELWIGTGKNGVYRMDARNEKLVKYPLGSGDLENAVTTITGKEDRVWIGTKKGLCSINTATDSAKRYSISQGLPHNVINCMYLDKSDKLWVSTRSNILAYIYEEKIVKLPINTGNGISMLGPITEDADSRIWIGSKGNGVFLIASDSIINLTTKEGLLSDYCYSLISDDHKNIWVGHKGGLSKIRTSDFSVKPISPFEGISDQGQFNPNAIVKDTHERVWFGSDFGLVSLDPPLEHPRMAPPVLGITSIRINDEDWDLTKKIKLPPGNYRIRIDFIGISLRDPALVTYQHKLDGFDEWSDITKAKSITYNHVTEGEYTFLLNASSADGAISEFPLTLSIVIKKPVWKKWWFYFIVAILLSTLVILYIKRREYKFQDEKRLLEEKVMKRTFEIECQKNEIELQRDIIDRKNASITSSILYASNIQNAMLPPQELIDKLLPENFILNKPKDIVSGDFYWLTRKSGKIVFAVADCTGHGVPGAFMSMLGITLLDEIVNVEGITRSDVIVTRLRKRVIESLQQNRKNITTSDGMDIALCAVDPQTKTFQYTGGMNDLVLIRDGNLKVLSADRLSVCILLSDYGNFTMQEIDYKKGDILYLFSDGYQDQFGGHNSKKYLSSRFYKTLLEIHELPMARQKELLDKKHEEWRKDEIQTDDIMVMGVRL